MNTELAPEIHSSSEFFDGSSLVLPLLLCFLQSNLRWIFLGLLSTAFMKRLQNASTWILILAWNPPTTEATTRGRKFRASQQRLTIYDLLLRSVRPQTNLPSMAVGTDSFLHLARPLAPSAIGVQPTTAPLNVIIQPQVRAVSLNYCEVNWW